MARSRGELSGSSDGTLGQAAVVDARAMVAGSGQVRPGKCIPSDVSSLQFFFGCFGIDGPRYIW